MKTLNPKEFEALKAVFSKTNGCSVVGLMREMKIERALANNLIDSLVAAEFLHDRGNNCFGVTRTGRDVLIANGVPGAERKTNAPLQFEALDVKVLDLPPSDQSLQALAEMTGTDPVPEFYQAITESKLPTPEDSDKLRSVWNEGIGPGTKPAGKIVFSAPTGDWGKVAAVAAAPAEERPDFTTLVRNGLERLNRQLGRVDAEIENIDLKIETLAKLSVSVEKISAETAEILRAISKDLHRIRYNYTGDDARSSK